jgi:hypothetical protein
MGSVNSHDYTKLATDNPFKKNHLSSFISPFSLFPSVFSLSSLISVTLISLSVPSRSPSLFPLPSPIHSLNQGSLRSPLSLTPSLTNPLWRGFSLSRKLIPSLTPLGRCPFLHPLSTTIRDPYALTPSINSVRAPPLPFPPNSCAENLYSS